MSPSPLESVAVATVAYNSSAHLGPFLSSLRAGEGPELLVVVADNGSQDIERTREYTTKFKAELIELGANLGYGGAINSIVRTLPASIRYILVSNPDVEITPGAVTALAAAFERLADAGAIGPRVLNSDGSVYPSARKLPSLRTGIGHALFGGIWPSNPWSSSYREESTGSDRERSVGWLSGSFVMVSREAWNDLGGFDEGFFMYFEDVDLGYRLGKNGWKSYYVPSTEVLHTGAHSTTTESARMIQVHHDSAYRYLGKKYSAGYLAPLRWMLRAGLSIRAGYLIRKSRTAA